MPADFLTNLAEMRDGEVSGECAQKWQKLIGAVLETGKKGKFVLTIEIQPAGNSKMEITAKPAIVEPTFDAGKTIFFISKSGDLTRNDPRQQELFEQRSK